MRDVEMTTEYANKSALVTGANSGLGFEAAAQLATMGYGSVVLACRSLDKAETARKQLVERTGEDPFSTIVVDVGSVASSAAAAQELVAQGSSFDAVLLNAGMVPSRLDHTDEGIEACFAASLVGHHVVATALLDAGLIDGGNVVIVGSEAANNDLPKMMGMSVYDFALGEDSEFGSTPAEAMKAFALASGGPAYDGSRQYSTTKTFSSWWSAGMARRHGDGTNFFTVSPGANMSTNAARHAEGSFKVMVAVMSRIGRFVGMDQPVAKGAKRYIDVLNGIGEPYESGRTYTSAPKKMTGPLVLRTEAHLLDEARQDTALAVLDSLVAERSEVL
jgi:NAD(P)-dependent dehydrogenase (short-subunit alcohol dehydrogenase family)